MLDVPASPLVPLFEAIIELVPRLSWGTAELADHRHRELSSTLRNAIDESPWHRERLTGLDPNDVHPDDLRALPTMTKQDLMANWDDIVTDPRVTLAAARKYLDGIDERSFQPLHGEYLVFSSGGSTGEPGVFCWSSAEMARWGASSIRWSAVTGLAPPKRQAWVGARSLRHPSAVASLLTGGTSDLTVAVDQPVRDIIERLNDLQPDALSVICSMLPLLVESARKGDLRITVDRIAVFGDVLDPTAAAEAASIFGVEPLESYPTTDVGYIAQQAPGERGLYVNDDLLIVEPVDAAERPVEPGEMSDHLLVTSLHQRTLPMLRYRIDDRVVFDPRPGDHAAYQRILEIDGRSDDIFRYDGVAIHPHVFRTVLSRHSDVRDYEIRQTAHGADVSIQTTAPIATVQLADELRQALGRAGLPQPEITVLLVDDLTRTAVGKRRRFVPV